MSRTAASRVSRMAPGAASDDAGKWRRHRGTDGAHDLHPVPQDRGSRLRLPGPQVTPGYSLVPVAMLDQWSQVGSKSVSFLRGKGLLHSVAQSGDARVVLGPIAASWLSL